ncbi:hypothetical protein D6_00279 [Faustovirus]|nr:hypothetical protein D6_00279 [Faustovirus]
MMLTIYSPLDIQPTEDSVATLTWTIVRKVRIGQLDLDDPAISDIDKHVFDEHNAIIAVRYLFRE